MRSAVCLSQSVTSVFLPSSLVVLNKGRKSLCELRLAFLCSPPSHTTALRIRVESNFVGATLFNPYVHVDQITSPLLGESERNLLKIPVDFDKLPQLSMGRQISDPHWGIAMRRLVLNSAPALSAMTANPSSSLTLSRFSSL